jgi:penicillin-binding protein 1A
MAEDRKQKLVDGAHPRSQYRPKTGFLKRWWKAIVLLGLILVVGLGVYAAYVISGLPSLEQLDNPKPDEATRIYSADGEVIAKLGFKNRTSVLLDSIPKPLISALLATEDRRFYRHWGIDLVRVVYAFGYDILHFGIKQGASTITQQLARNLYSLIENEENVFDKITRKIREAITAIQIERTYTKDEILELYLNVSYFGRSAYGVEAAAEIYFDKSATELNVQECALLVGLLRSPGVYDPVEHPERAYRYRNVILNNMVRSGFLSEEEYTRLKSDSVVLRRVTHVYPQGISSHFTEWIRQSLMKNPKLQGYDLFRDGLKVYTTLDKRMQEYLNRAVSEHLADYQVKFDKLWTWEKKGPLLQNVIDSAIKEDETYRSAQEKEKKVFYNRLKNSKTFVDSVKRAETTIQVGAVVIDPTNGHIRAMVGGSNLKFGRGLNHVTQIRRQPGSAFKPFVYTAVIDNGYSPCYEILNQPFVYEAPGAPRWSPENFGTEYGGMTTLRDGLAMSINVLAARAIVELTKPEVVVQYAHQMGIKTEIPPYPSIALGSAEVIPLELTSAFGAFANEGILYDPIAVLRIEDRSGKVVEENSSSGREVLGKETAYIMTDMLESAVNYGTAAGIRGRDRFYLPAAGKTGTTNEYSDAWFVGFTPQYVAGIWVGFDDKRVSFGGSYGQGGRAAAPVWGKFMKYIYDDKSLKLPVKYFAEPPGVVTAKICDATKRLATEFCPHTSVEVFNKKNLPDMCAEHTSFEWRSVEKKPRGISY